MSQNISSQTRGRERDRGHDARERVMSHQGDLSSNQTLPPQPNSRGHASVNVQPENLLRSNGSIELHIQSQSLPNSQPASRPTSNSSFPTTKVLFPPSPQNIFSSKNTHNRFQSSQMLGYEDSTFENSLNGLFSPPKVIGFVKPSILPSSGGERSLSRSA